jgi:hypothetical protein
VEVLNDKLVAAGVFEYNYEADTYAYSFVFKAPYDAPKIGPPPVAGVGVFAGAAVVSSQWDRNYVGDEGAPPPIRRWDLWVRTVGGRLYAGGGAGRGGWAADGEPPPPTGISGDVALDVTGTSNIVLWSEETSRVSFGCLGSVPSAEIGEGFGASEEA